MMRRTVAVILCIVMTAAFILLTCGVIVADPVQEKKDELERIKNEVQGIDSQLEAVTEQYNMTNLRVEQTRASIAATEQEIASLTSTLQERKDILGKRIRELYKAGNADVLEVITECKTMDDLMVNVDSITRISGNDVSIIVAVVAAREDVEIARGDLEAQKTELDAAVADLERQQSQIEGELQRRQNAMSGVEAEVNALIAEEEANAAPDPYNPRPPRPIPPPPDPPPYAPQVVQVAYAQIGKPYRYAGSGPDVFDCSGLVMYCYAQVGISLPHSSYMQASLGAPVSYADLAPGDLVFFHGNGHVGMYVGGGQYIHAPYTGAYVRVNDLSVRRDFCGARRII
jgi:cell wall-associated NlpC family hydrolase